jgi:two-component system, NtrC family, sensor histidine kinase PilS
MLGLSNVLPPASPAYLPSAFDAISPDALDASKQRRLMLISVLRLALAVLLAFYLAIFTEGTGRQSNALSPGLIAVIYALVALAAIWAMQFSPIHWRGQLFAQLLADVVLIGLLVFALGGSGGGYAIIYILPIAAAASLLSWTSAMFICAVSVISLMLDGVRRSLIAQQEVDWFLMGVQGLMGFALMATMRYTAARAEHAETTERKAKLQTFLVQELQEQHIAQDNMAWLVLDAQYRVQVLNAAARSLAWQAGVVLEMGDSIAAQRLLAPWLNALTSNVEISLSWPANSDAQTLHIKAASLPHLKGYTALTMELHSARTARNQQQHLEAMGRVSASIAHEIRNPLAAISQAAELLQETTPTSSVDAPLLAMIYSNTQRIDRIVHNLLAWSHGVQAQPTVFEPVAQIAQMLGELRLGLNLNGQQVHFQTQLQTQLESSNDEGTLQVLPQVVFDTDHLYQILSNLLSNAARYATGAMGSVRVLLRSRGRYVALLVLDDGPAVDAGVQQHLFEPFQTASKQGTGLGLFLSREFAQANHASLELMLCKDTPQHPSTSKDWVLAPYTKAFVLNMPIHSAINSASNTVSNSASSKA